MGDQRELRRAQSQQRLRKKKLQNLTRRVARPYVLCFWLLAINKILKGNVSIEESNKWGINVSYVELNLRKGCEKKPSKPNWESRTSLCSLLFFFSGSTTCICFVIISVCLAIFYICWQILLKPPIAIACSLRTLKSCFIFLSDLFVSLLSFI